VVTEPAFDETIHAPTRLRICGLLRHIDEMDFAVLRDTLGISDASLSKHLKVLLDAGYVSMSKNPSQTRSDARRLTWIKQTHAGRYAFDAHMEELRRIAEGFSDGLATHPPTGSTDLSEPGWSHSSAVHP
jgi:DNA-binding MarR family transcriptional regulator